MFCPVSQQAQIKFIFNDNVRILCLFCISKSPKQLPNFLKIAEASVFNGVICDVSAYTVIVSSGRSTWSRYQKYFDVTHDNASYMVTSNFDVLGRKFGYQNQCCLNAFYSVQYIIINSSACLYLCVCPCCYLLFWFPGFYRYDRRDEQTNEPMDSYS